MALLAALAVGALAVVSGGGGETLSISVPSISTITTTTTTTTTLPTTTTSTSTTSTSTTTVGPTTTTTTMVPVPTTIFENAVPIWEPYETLPGLDGFAALTGEVAGPEITERPIIAAKIDNYSRARPQWGHALSIHTTL